MEISGGTAIAPQTTGTTKSEIAALTGVRAFASWWVVLFHLRPAVAALAPEWSEKLMFTGGGGMGVDLFFILSGFVLTHNYQERFAAGVNLQKYGRFLRLRLARIYPAHLCGLAVWGAYLLLNLFLKHRPTGVDTFGVVALIRNLLLVHGWWIPLSMTWNYPAWSISMEWLAYLFFPALMLATSRIRGIVGLLTAAFGLLAAAVPLIGVVPAASHLIRIGCEFGAGCLLWNVFRTQNRWLRLASSWLSLPLLAGAVALAELVGWWSIPAFGCVILSLAWDDGAGARLFGSKVAVYWGKVSYSLYIMHAAMISACHVALPLARFQGEGRWLRYSILLAYAGVIAAGGMGCYHFVEEPARKWIRSARLEGLWRGRATGAAAGTGGDASWAPGD